MNALIGKVIIDIGRTVGKAVLAGVGLELAKVASDHLRKRLGPKDPKKKTPEEIEAENEKLKAEIEKLREELATARR